MTSLERGMEMMLIPMGKLPPLALKYGKLLCSRYGMCGEVLLTAWCHYAEAIEGLSCDDDLYQLDSAGAEWFKAQEKARLIKDRYNVI